MIITDGGDGTDPPPHVIILNKDGSIKKITQFDLIMDNWWKSESSNKKYPLSYTVVVPPYSIDLAIKAFKEDQVKKIAGKEYWYGFGSVTGTIQDAPQNGWAYISPLGIAE